MLDQKDMTETAKRVLTELSEQLITCGEIVQRTNISWASCQLILTQLVMADLAEFHLGCYRRRQ